MQVRNTLGRQQLQRKAAPNQMSSGAEIKWNFFRIQRAFFNREKFIEIQFLGSSLKELDRQ